MMRHRARFGVGRYSSVRDVGSAIAVCAAGCAVWIGSSSPAAAQIYPECGENYSVGAGETLSSIAEEAFLDGERWLEIYRFGSNSQRIGPNPNDMYSGLVIEIPPCDAETRAAVLEARRNVDTPPAHRPRQRPGDGVADDRRFALAPDVDQSAAPFGADASNSEPLQTTLASIASSAAPTRPAPASATQTTGAQAALRNEEPETIELLTGGDYAPIVDRNAPSGGMVTQIVEASFLAANINVPVRVDFVNDWAAHLPFLLRDDKYAFGFPWPKPNCNAIELLPENERLRCDYIYSEPIYIVAIDTFGPANLFDPPRSFADLRGKRICRPVGWVVDDLITEGLIDGETITLVRAANAIGCFDLLERGEVDFVSISRFPAESAISEMKLGTLVRSFPSLVSAQSLHLIMHREEADEATMAAFNRGLLSLKQSGEWDRIVNWHLQQFRRTL